MPRARMHVGKRCTYLAGKQRTYLVDALTQLHLDMCDSFKGDAIAWAVMSAELTPLYQGVRLHLRLGAVSDAQAIRWRREQTP